MAAQQNPHAEDGASSAGMPRRTFMTGLVGGAAACALSDVDMRANEPSVSGTISIGAPPPSSDVFAHISRKTGAASIARCIVNCWVHAMNSRRATLPRALPRSTISLAGTPAHCWPTPALAIWQRTACLKTLWQRTSRQPCVRTTCGRSPVGRLPSCEGSSWMLPRLRFSGSCPVCQAT